MKVYISGKITGDPGYKQKFRKAAETLEAMGLIVLNPALLPEGMEPEDYMRICCAMMESADIIIMLPGWEYSQGAALEKMWGRYVKLPCYEYDEFVSFVGGSGKKQENTV